MAMCALVLVAGCRVDARVDVDVDADGSGSITVTVVADADVVTAAPGLVEDLALDDVVAGGWTVDGPDEVDGGGLRLELTHAFGTVDEATVLLRSLNGAGGPLQDVGVARVVTDDEVTTTLTGSLRVDGGVGAFTDPELLAAIGAVPYAHDIAAAGLSPDQAIGLGLTVDLPGSVDATTSTAEDGLAWAVPLDGTPIDLATAATIDRRQDGGAWASLSTIAFGALIVWCVAAIVFIVAVAIARRRRGGRRPTPTPSR